MRRLARHIGSTVFSSVFLALCVIVGLDVVAAVIDETGAIQRNYHFSDVLVYVFTKLPSTIKRIYSVFYVDWMYLRYGAFSG